MPWLKLLHITAVIVWAGGLLYLPALVAAGAKLAKGIATHGHPNTHVNLHASPERMARLLFTGVTTPAALIAIASGSAIFLLHGPTAAWLVAKLGVVALLVLAHGACGMLVLRVEDDPGRGVRRLCIAITAITVLALGVVAWLVLGKPF